MNYYVKHLIQAVKERIKLRPGDCLHSLYPGLGRQCQLQFRMAGGAWGPEHHQTSNSDSIRRHFVAQGCQYEICDFEALLSADPHHFHHGADHFAPPQLPANSRRGICDVRLSNCELCGEPDQVDFQSLG